MEDFHQQFSSDAVKTLKNLQNNFQSAEEFSDSERREVFRTLHTIKGTAQTFGFSAASRLAHELEIVLSAEKFANDLRGIVSKAIAHGKDLSRNLDKDVDFKFFVEEINISDERLKLVFDVLIHLIRNAVDHGIENVGGEIEVNLKRQGNGLNIIVAVNGNGVNLKRLRARAVEKN